LGNSPNTQTFEEFLKYPDIWGISQMTRFLGDISNHLRSFKNL